MMRRIRNLKSPPSSERASNSAPYQRTLSNVIPWLRSSIAYLRTQGPPVVFLHGLFGQGRNWTTVAKALSASARVILVDLPNHGRSAWTEEFSYAGMADQVSAFANLPGSPVIVYQDLDDPVISATFGEVMCSVYKAYGAQGMITSGAGRDLDQVERLGFPCFTRSATRRVVGGPRSNEIAVVRT